MVTVTRPPRTKLLPTSAPAAPEVPVADTARSFFGDRIAFFIWITCALFMASLLAYDTVMGVFR